MAQQSWNVGSTGHHSPSLGTVDGPDALLGVSEPVPVPLDVLLLGPRDEKDKDDDMAPPKIEKSEYRPAPASYMPPPRKNPASRRTILGLSALVLVAVGIPSVAYLRSGSTTPAEPTAVATPTVAQPSVATGSATVISRPDGAQIFLDGALRGVTPTTLTLPVGNYTLELQNGTNKRSLPLVIEPGTVVRQYVDLAPTLGDVGRLEVTSDPAGAQVSVDGAHRGVTPLTISSIEPGQHRVTISGPDGSVNRSVIVAAGATASVVATLAPAGSSGGWVSVAAPFEMQVLENGQVIGSSTMERLMLPAGKHELEFVSAAFEFSTTMTVQVPAGKTVTVPVALPKGTLSINALPWADVWLDGQPMGTTPLGNISTTVGNHEVVWRHPQLGERRQVVKVTSRAPVRAGVDFSK
jgi:PEGA domain